MSLKRTVLRPELNRVSRVAAKRLGLNLNSDGLRQGTSEAETATSMQLPAATVREATEPERCSCRWGARSSRLLPSASRRRAGRNRLGPQFGAWNLPPYLFGETS